MLNLGGCQSSNFDAQITDTTITMIAYVLLAFRFRYENYESMGALFRTMNAEHLKKTIDIRLWELFSQLIQTVCQMIEKDIEDVMDYNTKKSLSFNNHKNTIYISIKQIDNQLFISILRKI